MHSDFRFIRHGCGLGYDASVRLHAESADVFSVAIGSEVSIGSSRMDALVLGIRAAHAATQDAAPLAVTVVDAIDHSGATGELGFKICGEAAMYRLLGLPDRAPFPGHVLDES